MPSRTRSRNTTTIQGNFTFLDGAKLIFDLDNTALTVIGTLAFTNSASFGVDDFVSTSLIAIDWSLVSAGTYSLISKSFNFTVLSNFGAERALSSAGKYIYFANAA